jgi:hypothetical protein
LTTACPQRRTLHRSFQSLAAPLLPTDVRLGPFLAPESQSDE